MKNPNIARMLKYYRKYNGYSVPEVAKYLSDANINVAEKTIYGWESGQTQPSADTLMTLCSLYGVDDILSTFGYTKNIPDNLLILNDEETRLVQAYRDNPSMQEAIKKLLNLCK